MIDLHMHSQVSDGLDAPEMLAKKAVQAGLSAVALTDHDAVDGVAPLQAAAAGMELRIVPGVEFDTDHAPGTLHMLGYFVDTEHPGLCAVLSRLREGRTGRIRETVAALSALGMPLDESDVWRESGGGSVGRPHVARLLRARGYVSSVEEAFNRFLAEGRPAYVGRYREAPEQAIRGIREAGGVAVLAHPKTLRVPWPDVEAIVERLVSAGLGGIEAYYPDHTMDERRRLARMARRWDLAATGGTDYHGEQPGRPGLGVGYGNLDVPDTVIDELRARCPG